MGPVRLASGEWLHRECEIVLASAEIIEKSRTRIQRARARLDRFQIAHPPPVGAHEEPAAPGMLEGVSLLAVDDDLACLRAYARLLRAEGANVAVAAGAREGLTAFHATRPKVVLTDLAMPGEDGCWLMREIRDVSGDRARRPRALVVTAHTDPSEQARCLASGFDAFLAKPVDPALLVAVVAGLRGAVA